MERTSSPGRYSRTSANSIPCPLKLERYSPLKREFTIRRVRSSTCRTWRSSSVEAGAVGAMGPRRRASISRWSSRYGDGLEDSTYDIVGGDFLRLGLVCGDDSMTQDVAGYRLDVLRQHVLAASQEGVSAGTGAERE